MAQQIINAQIRSTSLGYEDHGILSCWLQIEWEGAGVGFGGFALDEYDPELKKRVARSGIGLEFIAEIMRTVGVENWEDLKGKYVRLDVENLGGKALGIGHLLKDKWLYPADFFAAAREKAATK